jgi:aryl-phospho-beta-D-glucosidase BglC (GH1 family)
LCLPRLAQGINWFGLETDDFALHGLWSVNLLKTLDFVAQHFNAVRLPFSAELALNMEQRRPGNINYDANPELRDLTTGQVMDRYLLVTHTPTWLLAAVQSVTLHICMHQHAPPGAMLEHAILTYLWL